MSSSSRYYERWKIMLGLCHATQMAGGFSKFQKLRCRNLPGSLCFARLEVGVGGGVVPVPWALDAYVDSVDSREPAC